MLTPLSAHSGYWTPGARLLPPSIRGWWDDLVPNTSSSWADRRGAGPLLGGAGPLGNGSRKGRVTATFPGTSGAWLTSVFTNPQPFTIFFACRFGAWGTSAVLMDGASVQCRVQRQSVDSILLAAGGSSITGTFSSSLTNRFVIVGAVFNGVNSSVWENGVMRAAGNAGTNNPTGLTIGAANGGSLLFSGELAEIPLFAGAMNPTLMGECSRYLMREWV